MSGLALTSGWYYICTSYYTPDTRGKSLQDWLRDVKLQNNLSFSLYAAPSIYHMVVTSDRRKKSGIGVSTDWCITIKHQRLSSIRIIFVDNQTRELQCNYQSYIQGDSIGDAWGFSSVASIAPSGGFSVETLTGV